jgi:branched-chain amino acid aminotransferase
MAFINFNGKILDETQPILAANTRGLRYGDGLFETIKFKNQQIILLDEHLARLWNGMKMLQFDIPKLFTPDALEKQIIALIQKNNLLAARIRITIFRGMGGLYDPINHQPNYIIETYTIAEANKQLNTNGLQCCIYKDALKSTDAFANLKNNNYLPYLMAALFAKKQKCNDAILLNQQHQICDSTIANVFLIKDNVIFTPALSEGCVAGIMRNFVISTLKNNGFSIIEKSISEDELLDADEVFLTNSIYNIQWVAAIDNKNYHCQTIMEIDRLLAQTNPFVYC